MKFQCKESDIIKEILDFLELKKIPAIRIQNVGIWDKKKQAYRRVRQKGYPDIVACVNGHFVAIEVKGPKGVVSPEQREFLERIEQAGGLSIVARSAQFVKTTIAYALWKPNGKNQ